MKPLPQFLGFALLAILAADSAATDSTSFEHAKAGPFKTLTTNVGQWTTSAGFALVDDKHATTGKHCLQLAGGKQTTVELKLADEIDPRGNLTFRAERWTVRKPFSFRIEKQSKGKWSEIFNGDAAIRVGRPFLSTVDIPLKDADITHLRFTVVSPPATGILIDDLKIAPPQPQRIVAAEVVPCTLPALVGADWAPLAKVKIETVGRLEPIALTELTGRLSEGTNMADIKSIRVFIGNANGNFSTALPFGDFIEPTANLAFTGKQPLKEGANYLWLACKLSDDANIDHFVGATIGSLTFSDKRTIKFQAAPSVQRLGVSVRNKGDDNIHTFRIPGLATTNKGTLIAVYDVRRRSGGDLPGDIDVGMSRSTDGGRTWQPMKIIMDMGDDPEFRYEGIGDPAVLVDAATGSIWVAATWSHGNRSWHGSGPGLKPEETGQLMLVRSDDDGVTWSKPINITSQVKKPEWSFLLQGPGKGITMRDGAIVFPAQYRDSIDNNKLPRSTIIYSQDHGKTWRVGAGAFDDTTESQVVEIEPGKLMLNCRYNRKSTRVVMTTSDMGKTWKEHVTSQRSLIEPGACMASLINVDREVGKDVGGWLLFSNPDSTSGRNHITIKGSPDAGLTWPKNNRLLLDQGNSAGYSCMTMIDEKTVGILYEGSQAHMTFQRIPLIDIVGRKEKPKSPLPKTSLRLPQVFGDFMVLQADTEIPVWGTAAPGAKVTVELGDDQATTTAGDNGKWKVQFAARPASAKPIELTVNAAGETIRFKDILVGEVWLCAGQSNMEWTLSKSTHGGEELAAANHDTLRLLHLQPGASGNAGSYTPLHLARLTPDEFCHAQWKVASADSAASFSAVAWYFGRELQRELKVPVGLVCPAVGGTPTESWVPCSALQADPELRGLVNGDWLNNERMGEFCRTRGWQNLLAAIQAGEQIPGDEFGPNHPFKPGYMWSAGIEPLLPFSIRGVIWYQGESNAETNERAKEHGRLFPLLVQLWRKRMNRPALPFLLVQLPAINRPAWPLFRDGQRRVLHQLENVGMAITIDTGHPTNVHPPLKKPVGERLAKWALGDVYNLKSHATFSGPLLEAFTREGDSLVIKFQHVGDGLKANDGKPLRHFEIRDDNGGFHPATAKITGEDTIVLSSSNVSKPTHARYAWSPYPAPPVNLFNSENLPASPFTTEPLEMTANSKRPFARPSTTNRIRN